jgi:hypothetical protein
MTGKKAVGDICHRFYPRPPQDSKPAMFADSFPCVTGYVQTIEHLAVTELAMQYPVGPKLVDIRISLDKVRCVYVLELDPVIFITASELVDLCAAQGTQTIIENGEFHRHDGH